MQSTTRVVAVFVFRNILRRLFDATFTSLDPFSFPFIESRLCSHCTFYYKKRTTIRLTCL